MSTQQERDHNNLVRDTRAHLGSIIDELQRRYSRVDGSEGVTKLDDGFTLVDLIVACCAGADGRELTDYSPEWEDCIADIMGDTIQRYCK